MMGSTEHQIHAPDQGFQTHSSECYGTAARGGKNKLQRVVGENPIKNLGHRKVPHFAINYIDNLIQI